MLLSHAASVTISRDISQPEMSVYEDSTVNIHIRSNVVCSLIFVTLSAVVSGTPTGGDRLLDGRIVNGTDAKLGQYPFMVSLRQVGEHFCGASVINEFWVLTAAHCVYRKSLLMDIQAGATELSPDGGAVRPVYRAVIHPEYSEADNYRHDIAVLELMTPLDFSDVVQPVKLPTSMQDTPAGTPATVIGWGLPYSNGPMMSRLQTVDLQVFSDRDCAVAHQERPHPSNICAGVPEGGKGQCNGDSGGPLLALGLQVGIVSWSKKPCALQGYPGVFTEVSQYVDWINSTLNWSPPERNV